MISGRPERCEQRPVTFRFVRQISDALLPIVNRVIKKTIPMPPIAQMEPPVIYSVSRNPLNYLNFLPRPPDRDRLLKVSVQ